MGAAVTPPMIETLTALLLAHLLADFVFQTNWMVAHKRNPGVLALHGLIVFGLGTLALGGHAGVALALTAAHLAIDLIKLHALPDTLAVYLGDQAAHLVTLVLAALLVPDTIASGLWHDVPTVWISGAALVSGLIVATLAGGPAVGLLMAPYKDAAQPKGLENAGRIIGILERALIFLMVMIGEPTGIGFLIAAKSILRFDTVSKDQAVSEYVIIGTLASFGWALVAAFATQSLMKSL